MSGVGIQRSAYWGSRVGVCSAVFSRGIRSVFKVLLRQFGFYGRRGIIESLMTVWGASKNWWRR